MKRFIFGIVLILNLSIIGCTIEVFANEEANNFESYIKVSEEEKKYFKELLKDKEIIALGEATHGTKEFFKIKGETFKFLVEEMGFRAFAMEDSMFVLNEVNNFINGEEYNLTNLLKEMGIPWQNEEVKEIILWAREHNEKAKESEKIRFYGFDNQESYSKNIMRALEKYYKSLGIEKNDFLNGLKYEYKDDLRGFFRKINIDLDENKEEYIKDTPIKEYTLIKKIVLNKIEFFRRDSDKERDELMARNVIWIKDYEKKYYNNERIMLWAHNGHVSNNNNYMGNYLKDKYKDKYYSIGMQFYSGGFVGDFGSGDSYKIYELTKSSKDSFSGSIYEKYKNEDFLFIDFKEASKDESLSDIINKELYIDEYGSNDASNQTGSVSKRTIGEMFDGVYYFKSTSPANYITSPKEITRIKISKGRTALNTLISVAFSLIVLIIWLRAYDKKNKDRLLENKVGAALIGFGIFEIISLIFNIGFQLYLISIFPDIGIKEVIMNCIYGVIIIISIMGILFKKKCAIYSYVVFKILYSFMNVSQIGFFIVCIGNLVIMIYLIYRRKYLFWRKNNQIDK